MFSKSLENFGKPMKSSCTQGNLFRSIQKTETNKLRLAVWQLPYH